MKKVLLFILVLVLACQVTAQRRYNKEAVAIGVRVGGNLASYNYSNKALNAIPKDGLTYRVRPMVGINAEIPLFKGYVYLAPEVGIAGRGDTRRFKNTSTVIDTLDIRYQAKVNYLEARLPIMVAFPVTKNFKPYVFAAPSFGLALSSVGPLTSEFQQISLDSLHVIHDTVAVGTGNMSTYDYGVTVGAGLRFKFDLPTFSVVVKVEGGYHWGFLDTYSKYEHNNYSQAVNTSAYNITGKRLNRGIEAAISIAIPLEFKEDMRRATPPGLKNKNRQFFGF